MTVFFTISVKTQSRISYKFKYEIQICVKNKTYKHTICIPYVWQNQVNKMQMVSIIVYKHNVHKMHKHKLLTLVAKYWNTLCGHN